MVHSFIYEWHVTCQYIWMNAHWCAFIHIYWHVIAVWTCQGAFIHIYWHVHTEIMSKYSDIEQIQLPSKLLDYFLWSNRRNILQHTATHCNTLQHTATHCNTLQHTATHCNTLQHTATHCITLWSIQRNTNQLLLVAIGQQVSNPVNSCKEKTPLQENL